MRPGQRRRAPSATLRAMDAIAEASRRAYRELVYETPGFVDFYQAVTPLDEIAGLRIGSRPARRRATRRIEELRAIPWNFAWNQARLLLPSWYGAGVGLGAPERGRASRAPLAAMYRALAVLPHRDRQPRAGAREGRSRHRARATPSWRGTCPATREAGGAHRGGVRRARGAPCARRRTCGACSQERARARPLARAAPAVARRALGHVQVELLRRKREAECRAAPAARDRPALRGDPAHDQRDRRGAAQHRLAGTESAGPQAPRSSPAARDAGPARPPRRRRARGSVDSVL